MHFLTRRETAADLQITVRKVYFQWLREREVGVMVTATRVQDKVPVGCKYTRDSGNVRNAPAGPAVVCCSGDVVALRQHHIFRVAGVGFTVARVGGGGGEGGGGGGGGGGGVRGSQPKTHWMAPSRVNMRHPEYYIIRIKTITRVQDTATLVSSEAGCCSERLLPIQ